MQATGIGHAEYKPFYLLFVLFYILGLSVWLDFI
jgi:hypothetical protein